MSSNLSSKANVTLSFRERLCFSTGDLAYNLVFAWVSSFLMIFYTDVFLIPAAAVSVLMLVVRLYDAINDPIIGSMMDKSHSRLGRYRPWIIVGGIGLAVSGVLMFWAHPDWSANAKLVYMYITYIVVVTFSTIFYMAYMAMTGCISTNGMERANTASLRMVMQYGGLLAVGYGAPYMIGFFGSQSAVQGYLKSVLICAVLSIPLFLTCSLGAKERVTATEANNVPMRTKWKALWQNKPVLILIICMTAHGVQMNGRLGVAAYYCTYVGTGAAVLATFNLINSLSCVAGCLLGPKLYEITGHKGRASAVVLFVCTASMLGQYFTTVPGAAFYLLTVLTGLCYGSFSTLMFSMIPDAVDLTQAEKGLRIDGFYNALASFGFKLGGALGTAFIGFALDKAGYIANQPQTEGVQRAIRALMAVMPAAFCLIAGIFLLWYKIDRKCHQEILAKIE